MRIYYDTTIQISCFRILSLYKAILTRTQSDRADESRSPVFRVSYRQYIYYFATFRPMDDVWKFILVVKYFIPYGHWILN